MVDLNEVKQFCINNLLIPFEGCATKLPNGDCESYFDPASPLARMSRKDRSKLSEEEYERAGRPWTIWWGLTYDDTGAPVRPGDIWTRDKAVLIKQKVLDKFLAGLLALSPSLAKQTPYRIAAVLSWVYNLGLGAYRTSTFKKRIDAEDWEGAAEECVKWNKAGGRVLAGLTRRRKAEAVFLLK